jgi:hypothetical protein
MLKLFLISVKDNVLFVLQNKRLASKVIKLFFGPIYVLQSDVRVVGRLIHQTAPRQQH